MAIPWLLALKVIPWGTILANAPSILRSADVLRSKTRVRPEDQPAPDLESLAARIATLEQRDRDSAELITQLTAQLTALTTAGEVLEARVRWLVVVAAAASVVAVVACVLALAPR
jgi:uncharacterized coiled-coil protein SlyX